MTCSSAVGCMNQSFGCVNPHNSYALYVISQDMASTAAKVHSLAGDCDCFEGLPKMQSS